MRLSLRGEYALRALMVLGERYSSEVMPIHAISGEQEIPKRFLEQILNDLKAGGLVESKRGVAGGYRLARPPEDISLASVVRQVEGILGPVSSSGDRLRKLRPGAHEARSAIGGVIQEVRQAMVKVLEGVTIADLCERARRLRAGGVHSPDYAI